MLAACSQKQFATHINSEIQNYNLDGIGATFNSKMFYWWAMINAEITPTFKISRTRDL